MARHNLLTLDSTYIGNTYRRIPLEITRAKGSWMFDKKGKQYLDLMSGIAVLPLGHMHPTVKKAVMAKLSKYMHLSNYFADPDAAKLAALITENSFADKVFFANTGAEATDVAIKLARKWARKNRNSRAHEIISMKQSFHGRTYGAISLTAQAVFHQDIAPLVGGIKHVPYNNYEAVKRAISRKTAAIFVEPVQCEGGINIPQIDFMTQLKNLCKKENILLIADEIQTGLGRTGKFLACEHSLMQPDIVLLAKSLGGGLPLSAIATTDAVASAFSYGDHGTTMGGNPLAATAGLATMEYILKHKLIKKAATLGDRFRDALLELEKKYPPVSGSRNLGLIMGFELPFADELVEECRKQGLIIGKLKTETVRMLPPFNLTDREFKTTFSILERVLKKLLKEHSG